MSPAQMNKATRALALVCSHFDATLDALEAPRGPFNTHVWPRWCAIGLMLRAGVREKEVAMLLNRRAKLAHVLRGLENELQQSCERGREYAALEAKFNQITGGTI